MNKRHMKQITKAKKRDLVEGYKQGEREFRAAREEFSDMQNRLFLQNYTLIFDRKKPKHKNVAATVFVSPTRSVARIAINDCYYDATPEDRRHYTIHELVHVILARLDYLISDLREQVSPQVYSVWYQSAHREIERITDAVTDIIAPYTLREDSANIPIEEPGRKRKNKRKSKQVSI